MCERCEDSSRCTSGGSHAPSDYSDEGKVCFYVNAVRMCHTMYAGNNLLLLIHELILVNEYRHGIDSRRHMLNRDSVVLEYSENLATESDLTVHLGLIYIYRTEALLTCNTGNYVLRLLTGALHNPCTRVLGSVGILNINRYSLSSNREDCILMKNGSTHVRKLSKLSVGNCFNRFRIINYTWIGYQESRYIRPVLIQVNPCCS